MKTAQNSRGVIIAAWAVLLSVSLLPKIILQEIFKQPVSPELQALMSLAVLAAAFLASLAWKPLRGLWQFQALIAVLVCTQWLVYNRLETLPIYRSWLQNPSFNVSMLAEQSLNLLVTLVVIAVLLLMRKKPQDFYLAKGNLAAPAGRIGWLGVKEGQPWTRLGAVLTVFISLGTLAFLVIAGRPPADIAVQALPYLPAILLAAALNSFNEEITYKASFLAVLESPVTPQQALYMVAAYFGIGHFYGVPYGVVGVILATFLGWILAKSMQETRGSFWAWFIHFWQDVWIFSFLAIGSIVAGGG